MSPRLVDKELPHPRLPVTSAQQLVHSGFVIIPAPIPASKLTEVSSAYDDAMSLEAGTDFNVGSTTNRLYDLVNRGSEFDDIYTYPPLLHACHYVIREPFKLSSLLGRTLRPGSSAQKLHVDFPRDSSDAPMAGFILMIDPFTTKNGATRFVPCSQYWADVPSDRVVDTRASFQGKLLPAEKLVR